MIRDVTEADLPAVRALMQALCLLEGHPLRDTVADLRGASLGEPREGCAGAGQPGGSFLRWTASPGNAEFHARIGAVGAPMMAFPATGMAFGTLADE